ncbi:hypothetical protein NPIL_29511, partial [Nephila pilipes]
LRETYFLDDPNTLVCERSKDFSNPVKQFEDFSSDLLMPNTVTKIDE